MERTPHKESALKVNSGEEISPAAPAGIRTRNLAITSPALFPTSYPSSWLHHHHNHHHHHDNETIISPYMLAAKQLLTVKALFNKATLLTAVARPV